MHPSLIGSRPSQENTIELFNIGYVASSERVFSWSGFCSQTRLFRNEERNTFRQFYVPCRLTRPYSSSDDLNTYSRIFGYRWIYFNVFIQCNWKYQPFDSSPWAVYFNICLQLYITKLSDRESVTRGTYEEPRDPQQCAMVKHWRTDLRALYDTQRKIGTVNRNFLAVESITN